VLRKPFIGGENKRKRPFKKGRVNFTQERVKLTHKNGWAGWREIQGLEAQRAEMTFSLGALLALTLLFKDGKKGVDTLICLFKVRQP
jgi:alpha-D-ribose 1-methylphosphonate 5-triphosphate synthase subunit PhnG